MRRISIKNIQHGMRLARSIYSADGQMLLGAGMLLKQEYIKRLEFFQISEVYIEDEISKDIEAYDVIHERTRVEARVLVKNILESSKAALQFNTGRVTSMVNRIIDELLSSKDILVNLSDIKTVDDYTFSHCVNVCVLSLITGIKLELNQLRLRDLGVGAILHDIGKVMIPEEILNKPSKLSEQEFEEIKKHTIKGYKILKNNPDINICSAFIALAHHERYNGSGYPLKLKGENIHLFARIVAVADVYDALTSDRVYRKKERVHEVIEYIASLGMKYFDKTVIRLFVKNIAIFPIGTGVLLSNGQKGIVVDVNRDFPARPIVRIIYNSDGTANYLFEEVDLTKKLNIVIDDTLEL